MIVRLLLIALLSSPLCTHLLAQGHFEYTAQCKRIYEQITSLQFDQARSNLARLRSTEPNNLVIHHLENYLDFFYLYVNGDEDSFNRLKPRRQRRLNIVASGDPNSPYYRYIQAEIYLQWALIRLRFGEQLNGFMDINRANRLLERNLRRHPDFMPNLKDLGILHAMVGTIPDQYQWAVKLLTSLNGTIEEGKRELEQVIRYARRQDFLFKKEARAMYAYLLMHLSKEEDRAWEVIRTSDLDPRSNPLHCFVMANIAMRSGHNNEAIELLEGFRPGMGQLPLPYLHYMLGLAKLRRLDTDAAPHFKRFIAGNKAPYYRQEVYQKLAWQGLINGKPLLYRRFMQDCLEAGEPIAGGDKNATKEAKSKLQPSVALIKARLLFDGAYYDRAYSILRQHHPPLTASTRHRLEYTYRLGRVLHGQERWQEAIGQYQATIAAGEKETYFFACNAALQIGLIHEKLGRANMAHTYFKRCLEIHPEEYKTGLHQQAKSGLSRLKHAAAGKATARD